MLEIKDIKEQISTRDKAKSYSAVAISFIIFIKINNSMVIISVLDVR